MPHAAPSFLSIRIVLSAFFFITGLSVEFRALTTYANALSIVAQRVLNGPATFHDRCPTVSLSNFPSGSSSRYGVSKAKLELVDHHCDVQSLGRFIFQIPIYTAKVIGPLGFHFGLGAVVPVFSQSATGRH